MTEIAKTAIVFPGTVIGEGCKILDYAVVGKQPTLSPRSTAKREELPPLERGLARSSRPGQSSSPARRSASA